MYRALGLTVGVMISAAIGTACGARSGLDDIGGASTDDADSSQTLFAGSGHTCVIRGAAAEVYCWGENETGGLVQDTSGDVTLPTPIAGVSQATGLAIGRDHACALHTDGSASCWGSSALGQLGRVASPSIRPPELIAGLPPVTAIGATKNATCALTEADEVWCWGYNGVGEVGRLDTHDRAPMAVRGIANVVALDVATRHVCAQTSDGRVTCWGDSSFGLFGRSGIDGAAIGLFGEVPQAPTWVPELDDVAQVAGGDVLNCAIRGDETVMCSPFQRRVEIHRWFRPVRGLAHVTRIAAGGERACAIRRDRTVLCWDRTFAEALGLDSEPGADLVPGVDDAIEIAVGDNHACIRRRDGAVYCWGNNDHGQLGIGAIDADEHEATLVTF